MSLSTFSVFYFGHTVTLTNNALDFDEGGPELQATLDVGDYSLTEYAAEVVAAMNEVGGQIYTASVNRTTRLITISAPGVFNLLSFTGSRVGTGAWSMMGYSTLADKTGLATYVGDTGSGSEYLPQHWLEDHIASDNFVEKNDAVVNETASGNVQVIQFGTTRYVSVNIKYANDYTSNYCQASIETQANGVLNLRTFMEYLITKAKFEYMPDRGNRTNFQKVLLDRTEKSRNGTAFVLDELKNAPGYFETGKLTLRVMT